MDLTEQVSVMGIIDRIRGEDHSVTEYIDSGEKREEIRTKLLNYYKQKQINVNPDVIESAITEWQSRRLGFVAPTLPWYFGLYIERNIWWPKLRTALTVLLIGIVLFFMLLKGYENWAFGRYEDSLESLSNSFQKIEVGMDGLKFNSGIQANYAYRDYLKNEFDATRGILNTNLSNNKETFAHALAELKQGKQIPLAPLNDAYAEANGLFSSLKSIVSNASLFERLTIAFITLTESKSFVEISTTFPDLRHRKEDIEILMQSTSVDLTSLGSSIDTLKSEVAKLKQIDPLRQKLSTMNSQLMSQLSLDVDKNAVTNSYNEAIGYLDNHQLPPSNKLTYFYYLNDIANTALKMTINPNNTGKTGIERTFDSTGGRAWYIVCQAIDPTGNAKEMQIKSNENGQTTLTKIFAVRVTEDVYNRVRADKIDDGIVNNNILAEKPLSSLSFSYQSGVSPEFITRW